MNQDFNKFFYYNEQINQVNNYKKYSFLYYYFEKLLLLLFMNKTIHKQNYLSVGENFSNIFTYTFGWNKAFWSPYSIYNFMCWNYKNTNSNIQLHKYHLVNPSSLPFLAAIGGFVFLFGLVLFMHNYKLGTFTFKYGLYFVILISIYWWRDVIIEGFHRGYHTIIVKKGLRIGMILFIVSEVMFFFSFFWAFFHSSLNPSIVLGSMWPPAGINPIDPMRIPLLNTVILLVSGVFLTWSHSVIKQEWWFNEYREKLLLDYFYFYPISFTGNYKIINSSNFDINIFKNFDDVIIDTRNNLIPKLISKENPEILLNFDYNINKDKSIIFPLFHMFILKNMYLSKTYNLFSDIKNWKNRMSTNFIDLYYMFEALFALIITILLGLEFTWWQYYEYYNATFYIFDGVYGSTFYMTTGLHGLHVLIGTIFLIVCLYRLYNFEFIWKSHIGYECAIWYWHFVDVVWILVFSAIYCWGAGFENFFKSY